jgi:cobalt-zinc-cadmium efflux system protein
MAHNHHSHGHSHDHGTENLSFAFWLNTGFALLEIAGGFYTNSVAILSDALHDLGDSLSLGLAYYFHRKSHQKRDQHYTYGYRRFSLLGALINCMVLLVGSIFILQETIPRLFQPQNHHPDAKGMLIFAIVGIAVNGAALLRLKKGTSINERVISLHFVEDVLGWVAVLVGSVVMLFADLPIIDPILSLFISGYILINVYRNLKSSFRIILQGIPAGISEADVKNQILSISNVVDIHDLHVWSMDGEYNVLTAHAVVDEHLTLNEMESVKQEVKQVLKGLPIQHVTIEIETKGVNCSQESC